MVESKKNGGSSNWNGRVGRPARLTKHWSKSSGGTGRIGGLFGGW